ncbi:MAG: 4Fe-4S dicluster domain-containing protein [Dehalococcoidia bacterium]|nr:4Fe-4S dicluster domain-containing protein [Dehalococcoidia bacterium]
MTTTVEDKLFTVKFKPDEHSHLEIKDQEVCQKKCGSRPCTTFCPAQVYKYEDQKLMVSYENCLECGCCRLACPYQNVNWRYPRGGFGVTFRYG